MRKPQPRKCRKCGKFSRRGRILDVPHRITGYIDPRLGNKGDVLPAGSFVCWMHFNAHGPCGLEPGMQAMSSPLEKHNQHNPPF